MSNEDTDAAGGAEPVQVHIFDRTYSLRSGSSDRQYLRRVAELVDERMRRIASLAPSHDALKVAVLAALNIADELERIRDMYEGEEERAAEPESAEAPAATERREDGVRSWFEDIFDSEPAPRRSCERLSELVPERLRTGRRAPHEGLNIEAEDERD